MSDYGITPRGFGLKPFLTILEGHAERARQVFGDDVDLRSTSALRKILDLAAFEDHELWRGMERLYYGNFLSTASGDSLDLLGADLGVERRFLRSRAVLKVTVESPAPGRVYSLPVGTLFETAAPATAFRSLERLALSADQPAGEVAVEAHLRGPGGDVVAGEIDRVSSVFAERRLTLGSATLAVEQEEAAVGGAAVEDDETYRLRLLGYPRAVWTLEAVRRATKEVDGVRDCRLLDTGGGVDVSQSQFGLFRHRERRFGSRRFYGSPYRFDVLVAVHAGYPWESLGAVSGVREDVTSALDSVRPVSIYPNVRQASHVRVGLRARVRTAPGHDREAAGAALESALDRRINALGLGRSVLYSEVLCDLMAVPGVVDVSGLHLRRCPPVLNRVVFGGQGTFQSEIIELAVGESLDLKREEIAEFVVGSGLAELEVADR